MVNDRTRGMMPPVGVLPFRIVIDGAMPAGWLLDDDKTALWLSQRVAFLMELAGIVRHVGVQVGGDNIHKEE